MAVNKQLYATIQIMKRTRFLRGQDFGGNFISRRYRCRPSIDIAIVFRLLRNIVHLSLSILNNPCQIPFCFPPSPYHSRPRFTCHSPDFRSGNGCTGKRSETQTLGISSVWFGRQKAVPKRSVITIQCCSIRLRFQEPSSNLTGHLRTI